MKRRKRKTINDKENKAIRCTEDTVIRLNELNTFFSFWILSRQKGELKFRCQIVEKKFHISWREKKTCRTTTMWNMQERFSSWVKKKMARKSLVTLVFCRHTIDVAKLATSNIIEISFSGHTDGSCLGISRCVKSILNNASIESKLTLYATGRKLIFLA